MRRELEPIITKEWVPIRIALMVGVVVGLAAVLVAFTTFRGIRGRATAPALEPTPLAIPSPVPPPKTQLIPPYLRLVTAKETYTLEETVSVDLYLDTDDQEVAEVNVAVTYDQEVLDISKDDIVATDVFKALNVQEAGGGRVTFSLFITPTVGHAPVRLADEAKIATIKWKTKSLEKQNVSIEVEYAKGDAANTSLIPYSEQREAEPENILESVEDVLFDISTE